MGEARRRAAWLVAAAMAAASVVAAGPAAAQTAGPQTVSTPVITTTAGTGVAGFGGDGGKATAAQLDDPAGLAEDATGNLYIGEIHNNRVRKVATTGIISTVAGTGQAGFGGDDGPAIQAMLRNPTGTAVDGAGALYIADTGNNRIRKVSAAGTMTTYAGNGHCTPDRHHQHSSDNGPATGAELCQPTGIAVDGAGNLYIADTGDNRIRKVSSTGVISTYAGTGAAGTTGDGGAATAALLNFPTGVALDAARDLFVADTGNNKVRVVNSAGIITTFAGTGAAGFSGDGGKATLAELAGPTGLGVDPLGNVYISDTSNNRVRIVIPKGDIQTYAGTGQRGFSGDGGPATAAKLNTPTGLVAVDGANVFLADSGNQRVRRIQGGPPPNIPETPFNLALLPLSAILLAGLAYVIARRRRGPARAAPTS